MDRVRLLNDKRKQDQELSIEMTRSFMALFYNANRNKNEPAVSGSDFFRLSYDGEKEERISKADQEKLINELIERFN